MDAAARRLRERQAPRQLRRPERATFAAQLSPLTPLAAILARQGKGTAAWAMVGGRSRPRPARRSDCTPGRALQPNERRREHELSARLQRLDKQIATLLSEKDVPAQCRQQAETLKDRRDAMQAELTRLEADLVQKYGVAAGQVYDLARIQALLPPDAALVGWLDIPGGARAADPNGEHWGCVVRHRGDPTWVKLPGIGPAGAWTDADEQLPGLVAKSCTSRYADPARDWAGPADRLAAQRLAPLEPHLGAGRTCRRPPV